MSSRQEAVKTKAKTENFHFADDEAKRLVQAFIKDESAITGKASMDLINAHLAEAVLTTNRTAAEWIRDLYLPGGSDEKPEMVGKIMDSIFTYFANQDVKALLASDRSQFVEFAYSQCVMAGETITENEERTSLFWRQADAVNKLIRRDEKTVILAMPEYKDREIDVTSDLNELKYLLDSKKQPSVLTFRILYQLVLDLWVYLQDKSATYRLLASMASLQKWDDTPGTRVHLATMIKNADIA